MYVLPELILFSPLILYAFFHTGKLIAGKRFREAFAAFCVFLAFGYPTAEILSHAPSHGWTKYAAMAGFCSLPYLLYFVLTFVFLYLAIGVFRLVATASRHVVEASAFRAVRLCVLLVTPAVIVFWGIVNNDRLQIREYSIDVPRKSSRIEQLKIAFASDFHLGDMTSAHLIERFADKVNALNPDIVLIGGDVLEGDRRDLDMDRFAAQFRRLRPRYGVYAVPGNHEHGAEGGRFFARSGVRLLQDSVENIDGVLYLAGRNDGRGGSRKSVEELLKDIPDDLPVVLLDHRPTDLEAASRSCADIQLSGHTHEGQLFPVNFITHHRYELSWGYRRIGHTHFIVTSGVQVWGPPVRTAGASEIIAVNVALRDNTRTRQGPNP